MKRLTLFYSTLFIFLSLPMMAINDSEIRQLEDFSRVTVATGINLVIIPGNKNEVEIEVDDIDLDDIITRVSGDKLVIKIQNWGIGIKKGKFKQIDVTLTYKTIEELSANSGASVSSDYALVNDQLYISAASGAEVELEIEGEDVEAKASSGSSLELEGECNRLYASVSTGSEIRCSKLEAAHVKAKANTGSDIRVWAKESLNARANTGATVKYKGNPEDITKKKGTGGSVIHI